MKPIIEIRPNGDPYGSGYVGTQYTDQAEYETGIGVYRGDIGARPRAWWRSYCFENGYIYIGQSIANSRRLQRRSERD